MSVNSILNKSNFPRLRRIFKSILCAKKHSSNECWSMDSLSQEDFKVENEWTVEVLRNEILEELLPLQQTEKSDSIFILMETEVRNSKPFDLPEINFIFLRSCFKGNLEYMKFLEQSGADISFFNETKNFNGLHLAALAGSLACCKWLVEKGCQIIPTTRGLTPLFYAVLGDSKEVFEYLLQNGCKISNDLLHCAAYAGAKNCMKLILSMNVEVDSYQDGMTPLHVVTGLRHLQCMKELLNSPCIDVNLKTECGGYIALHIAAEKGYADCIELLLDKDAGSVRELNDKLQTALHLSCKMKYLDCVQVLVERNAPINELDLDQKTPIHVAINKSSQCLPILKVLVQKEADTNIPDRYGYTPLHTAALNELEDCVTFLILNGANIAAETNCGVSALGLISRKTNNNIPAITKRLTQSISWDTTKGLEFDFWELINSSKIGEINFLQTLHKEGHEEVLDHPLCQAFLCMKWQKIKPYYFIQVFLVPLIVFLITFTVAKEAVAGCHLWMQNNSTEDRDYNACTTFYNTFEEYFTPGQQTESIWIIIVILNVFNLFRKLFCAISYPSLKNFLSYPMNVVEILLTVFVFLYCMRDSDFYNFRSRRFIGRCLVFFGWIYSMFVIDQLSVFGTYITMYKKVLIELLKIVIAHLSLLIGLTFIMSILLPDNGFFQIPFMAAFYILIMLSGNLTIADIQNKHQTLSLSSIFISLLIFFLTIMLMNFLISITIGNTKSLRRAVELKKLVRKTELIYFLERSVFHKLIPNHVSEFFAQFLFISPHKAVVCVRPLNPLEKRLPKKIMMAGYNLVKENRTPRSLESKVNEMYDLILKLNAMLQNCNNKTP